MMGHRHIGVAVPALAAALALMAGPLAAAEVNRYLPANTEMVVFVHVRQVLDSPLVKKHALEQVKAAIRDNVEGQKLLSAAGLDPLRDIHALTLAAPGNDLQHRALLIVTGAFDVDRIHALAADVVKSDPEALKVHREGDLRIYETKGKDGTGPAFAALMDRNTLLLSPGKDVLLAAVRAGAQRTPPVKKDLQVLIQRADAGQSLWFAALATSEFKELLKGNAQTATLAEKITSFSGTMMLGEAVQTSIHIHATDARAALEVHKLMETLKGFVQFAALSNKEYGQLLSDALDALTVSSRTNTVTIGGKVPGELIEKGISKTKKP